MQRIEQLKLELSKAIKESPEYIEYKRLEAIIDKDPNLKRSIDEFRRQKFLIYRIVVRLMIYLPHRRDLNNRYADMRRQDMVNRYLLSEVCLCRMVQDICRTVVETIEFDVDFLNN